jgi:hypothetical protein
MSTINEEPQTEVAKGVGAELSATKSEVDSTVAAAAGGVTDGADDGELERELQEMEDAATVLQREGMISESEAQEKREQVARTRRLFREMSREERAAIIRRRREIGRQLLDRQLSGAAIVSATVRLNHTRLKPLFEQWWPYLNRMSINMQRFGRATYGAQDQGMVSDWFEKEVGKIEGYVNEQLEVAQGFRERTETEMKERGETVFAPTVTLPSLNREVETYTRFSMRVLAVIIKFDRVMDHFDFLVWNGIRDQSDIDEETSRFLRKFQPIGLRGYTTHLRLMSTVRAA